MDNCQVLSFESCVMIGDENVFKVYVLPNVRVECNTPFLPGYLYGFMGVGPTLHLGQA